MISRSNKPIYQNVIQSRVGLSVYGALNRLKGELGVIEAPRPAEGIDGEAECGFGGGAGEDGVIGARAGIRGNGLEEGEKVVEAVGGGEGADHPGIGGVVVAEAIEGGGPLEDMEIEMGESGVVVELLLEEGEEGLRSERGVEV